MSNTLLKTSKGRYGETLEWVELDERWTPWKFQINGITDGMRHSMSNFKTYGDAERAFVDWSLL